MSTDTGRVNPGMEYQFKVITYTAVCLSENQDVRDFLIYTNKKQVPGFDDIIAKVWYKSQVKPFLYLGQIKHRTDKVNLNNKGSSVQKYKNNIKDIFVKKDTDPFLQELFENVPDENVEFWFFCNKYIQNTSDTNPIIVDGSQFNIIENKSYNSKFSITENAACYKLTSNGSTNGSGDLDQFHLFLNQPDNKTINDHILKCNEETFTKETIAQIIVYTTEYLQTFIGSRGLKKNIFEIHLLRLCLSLVTIPPTESMEIHDELAPIWNELCLQYDVTIIDRDVVDMKPYLFGILFKVIKTLLNDAKFNWNGCVNNWNKLSGNFDFEKFKKLLKREKISRWVPEPDILDTLLVEMWKCDFIPLILSSDCNISVLKKYQHLKKKFVVLDKNYKISREIRTSGLNVWANLSDVQDDSLRRQLLEGIPISLQGREPVPFGSIINNQKNLLKEVRCSQLLTLIKKPIKIFVQEQCLEHGSSMAFIISHDAKSNMEVSDDSRSSRGTTLEGIFKQENLTINCEPSEVEKHLSQIKTFANFKNYSCYHLKRQYPGGKLEYLTGDVSMIKHYLVDETGNEMHLREGRLTPIIGRRLTREDDHYIPRYLRRATVDKSFLDLEEERTLFLTGNVNTLEVNIKEKIIKEFYGDTKIQVEKRLKEKKSALVVVENENLDEHWSAHSTENYPMFQISVDNGALVLLKYKNYANLSSHITYKGRKFEEENFFEETGNDMTIIFGEVGLGKTALLHSLFQKYPKHNYILFCDLVDYFTKLKRGRKSQLLKKPLKYILRRCEDSNSSNTLLPKGFFDSLCQFHRETNRLLLIIDSFDEVLRVHKNEALEFVKNIAKSKIRTLITARPVAEKLLIDNFEVQPIRIEYLDEESAINYLKSKYVTDMDINKIPNELLRNPLYLKFQIAFSKRNLSSYSPNNTFVLYKNIMEKNIERFYEKRGEAYSLSYHGEDVLKIFKLLALSLIFGKKIIEDLEFNYDRLTLECMDTSRIDLGIIIAFRNGYPIFAQHKFAEFLAALWIHENIKTIPAQNIYKRLLDGEQQNVRFLLDDCVCANFQLHQAIVKGDLELVQSLCLKNKEYLKETDEYNRTPLHLAASYCKESSNEDIYVQKLNGYAKYKILDTIIMYMMKEKWDFNGQDLVMNWTWYEYIQGNNDFFDILHQQGLIATLTTYLNVAKRNINENDVENAIHNNQLHAAVVLLNHVPSLVKKYFDKMVKRSLELNDLSLILLMIELQNNQNEDFNSFRKICQNVQEDMSWVMEPLPLQNYTNFRVNGEFTALHLACMYENLEIVTQLLKLKVNSYSFDKFKNTSLHYGIMQGSSAIVSTLLGDISGGNHGINSKNTLGRTPIHLASMKENQDVVAILIRNGANIESCDEKGNTALHLAALYGEIGILKTLLEHGAKANAKDDNGNTALHSAAQVGRVDIVDALLTKEVDINIKGCDGNTALHYAIFYEHVDVLKSLLVKDANTNIQNYNGNTVLHTAITKGRLDIVEVLLQNGSDINLRGHNDRAPLHMAAHNGQTDIFRIILDRCVDTSVRDKHGNTALHCAVESGNLDIVQILLKRTIEINSTDRNGNTALHASIYFEQTDIFEMLLDHGADINIKNDRGDTVFHLAAIKGRIDILQVLFRKSIDIGIKDHNGDSPLHKAVRHDQVDVVKLFLRKGADFNIRNDDNNTPLHLASQEGKLNIIKILLKNGVDINLRGCNGNIPLGIAACRGRTKTVEMLLNNNADINIRNNNNDTILHLAVQGGRTDTIKFLLKKGMEVDLKGYEGDTSLCVAAYYGQTIAVKTLLERGADYNIRNDDNNTALHLAAQEGRSDIIEILLKQGMDIDLKGCHGTTPLCMAAYNGQTLAMQKLYENGANLYVRNEFNDTALHLAAREGNIETIKALLKMDMDVNTTGHEGATPLCMAAHCGQTDALVILLENEADVNIRNVYSNTALHLAAQEGKTDIVKILLELDMKVNSRGFEGYTALCMAAYNGQPDTLKILLENDGDVNIRNDDDNTALHLAVQEGKIDAVKILLNNYLDVNVRGHNGNTPLCIAAYNGRTDILKILLENEADCNIRNNENDTALDLAAREKKLDIVDILNAK